MVATQTPSYSTKFDVEAVLKSLTINEKVTLLGGKDFWHTVDIPSKGIPSVRVSDGPNGVRGIKFVNGTPSNAFPCALGLASSFDLDLAESIGSQLAREARAKGVHVVLGPTTNIQRSPLGGRGFESFSEDPFLSGNVAAGYIRAMQASGVAACIKHFVGNDQEFERFGSNSIIDERALREIYLEPFRIAQKLANTKCYMTSYNHVNHKHPAEDKELLLNILAGEWGFDGCVMTDWTGAYDGIATIKGGLDLEMPGPPVARPGNTILRWLQGKKVTEEQIDARVRRVLGLVKFAIDSGIPFDAPEEAIDDDETRELQRRAGADACVLLKNDNSLLPIPKSTKKIAVIGYNADIAVISGGGSASLAAGYTVTPLEGITAAAKEIGAEVTFSQGTAAYKSTPLADRYLEHPSGAKGNGHLEFFAGAQEAESAWFSEGAGYKTNDECIFTMDTGSSNMMLFEGFPEAVLSRSYFKYTSVLVPQTSGRWELSLTSMDRCNLYVDGKLVINNSTNWSLGPSGIMPNCSAENRAYVQLEKGKKYAVEIRAAKNLDYTALLPMAGCVRFGAIATTEPAQAILDAVAVAKEADVAIVVCGLNMDFESEGFDRTDLELPGTTNELVSAILKANPNTIIANQSGMPVTMPWVKEAHTLLQSFYAGNNTGNALADVLFGKVNPGSKLPVTFVNKLEDVPCYLTFAEKTPVPHQAIYNESIYVGYRHYATTGTPVMFPFGYGLSYTTFSYSDLKVSQPSKDGKCTATFNIRNTGKVAGREIAQLYVHDKVCSANRPVLELKGFTKVALEAGEKKTATIELTQEAFSFFDVIGKKWTAEPGEFEISVGASSADLPLKATVTLEEKLTWL